MSVNVTYSVANDFPNAKVDPAKLTEEIAADASITIAMADEGVQVTGDVCDIWFKAALPTDDKTALDAVVAAHDGEAVLEDTQDVVIKSADSSLPSQVVGFVERTGYTVGDTGYEFLGDPDAPNGITEHEAAYDDYRAFRGVIIKLDDNVYEGTLVSGEEGDYVELELVDVDGVLGYPAGTVLVRFGNKIPAWKGMVLDRIEDDAKVIPPGVYIRTRYVAKGTSKVRVKLTHVIRTVPAS